MVGYECRSSAAEDGEDLPENCRGWLIKLDAFINIVRHADRYLALEEGTPPYEVSPELEATGRFDFGGGLPLGMCAHPRINPGTGEMVVFRYDVSEPFLTWPSSVRMAH